MQKAGIKMKRKIIFAGLLFTMFFSVSVNANVLNNTLMDSVTNNYLQQANPKVIQKLKKIQKLKEKNLPKIEKYKNKLSDMGVVIINDSEEDFLEVRKEMKSRSKTVGYAVDGSLVTVIEQVDKWYKIRSGKIIGYIKTENVAVDDDVEAMLLDNESVKAKIIKDKVALKSKAKGSKTDIGMGYKNCTYPVIGFSNDGKKVRIQRTETIAGWVSINDVKIVVDADGLMTKEKYEEYQRELERQQEAELQKILQTDFESTGNKLLDSILSLVARNESGNYSAARNGLPQFPGEKTITVGAWQWYGERAHNLLRSICAADSNKAKKLIKDVFTGGKKKRQEKADKLYNDIKGSENWESSKRKFSKEELIAVKALLGSSIGVSVQNGQAKQDMWAKIGVAKNTYGLTNDSLIVYFCDLFWQNPENARKITSACIKHYKSAKKFNKDKNALKYMHEEAMKNPVMGRFSERRNNTYSVCKNLK